MMKDINKLIQNGEISLIYDNEEQKYSGNMSVALYRTVNDEYIEKSYYIDDNYGFEDFKYITLNEAKNWAKEHMSLKDYNIHFEEEYITDIKNDNYKYLYFVVDNKNRPLGVFNNKHSFIENIDEKYSTKDLRDLFLCVVLIENINRLNSYPKKQSKDDSRKKNDKFTDWLIEVEASFGDLLYMREYIYSL